MPSIQSRLAHSVSRFARSRCFTEKTLGVGRILEAPAKGLLAWLELVRSGALDPTDPYLDGGGRILTAPLQFWALHLCRSNKSQSEVDALRALFAAALVELSALGVDLDYFKPDKRTAFTRERLWSARYGHLSQRPVSHYALGADVASGVSLGVEILTTLLDAGCDPRQADAFGTPPLAICVCSTDLSSLEYGALLIDRGASLDQAMPVLSKQHQSVAQGAGASQRIALRVAQGARSITVRELGLAHNPRFISALNAREERLALSAALPPSGLNKPSRSARSV